MKNNFEKRYIYKKMELREADVIRIHALWSVFRGGCVDVYVADTIREINESDWNTLVGDTIECSHAWFRVVEDSSTRKMHYVLVRENGNLSAAACSYVYKEKMYSLEIPFLQVKCPLGISPGFFSTQPEETRILLTELEQIRRKEKAQGLLIFDLNKEVFNLIKKSVKGFTDIFPLDNTYIDLNYSDFDDYLTSLDEDAWRSARMTLNRARRWKIKTIFTDDFSAYKDTVTKLQECLCNHHNDFRMFMSEKFYEALENNLKENSELIIFFKGKIPLVSALVLNTPDTVIYKAAGIDLEHRKYQAYFLLYYEAIRKALERGQKRIYFGPTTYEFKERIGCKREELYGLVKMENFVLNAALKSYLSISRLWGKKF